MNFKKSFAICLSILTFAPFSSHAMKECNIEMSEINDDEKSKMLEPDSDGFENLNINELISMKNPKKSKEDEEKEKLGVYNLTCPICLDKENFDDMLALKCRHLIHQNCLEQWCSKASRKSYRCPVCSKILDSVRDAICQNGIVDVVDIDPTRSEEENLLNILRYSYVMHYILNNANPDDSLNDVDICCSTDDIDVGVLYKITQSRNGLIERSPCVLDFLKSLVCRVHLGELRDKFAELNNQAKNDVKNWTREKRESFRWLFKLISFKNFMDPRYYNKVHRRQQLRNARNARNEEAAEEEHPISRALTRLIEPEDYRTLIRIREDLNKCFRCLFTLAALAGGFYLMYKFISNSDLESRGVEGDLEEDEYWKDWDDNESSNPITKENNQTSNQKK